MEQEKAITMQEENLEGSLGFVMAVGQLACAECVGYAGFNVITGIPRSVLSLFEENSQRRYF